MTHDIEIKGVLMDEEQALAQWLAGYYEKTTDGYNVKFLIDWTLEYHAEKGDTINFNIDSEGGDVKHGRIIRNEIKQLAKNKDIKVTTTAVGMVGSSATLIFLAVKKENRIARYGSIGFIHNPTMGINGGSTMHENVAQVLRDAEQEMAELYSNDMDITVEDARKYMQDETLFSVKMMLDSGFAGRLHEDDENKENDIKMLFVNSCKNEKCEV